MAARKPNPPSTPTGGNGQQFTELYNNYLRVQNRLDQLASIQPSPAGTYLVDGKQLSAEQFRGVVNKATAERNKAKKPVDRLTDAAAGIQKAKQQNEEAANKLKTTAVPSERKKLEFAIARNNRAIAEWTTTLKQAGVSPEQVTGAPPGTATPTAPDTVAEQEAAVAPTGGAGAGGRVGAGPRAGRGGRAGGKKPPPPPTAWEDQLRRFFPQQSWMLDLDRAKYPKLFGLLERAYRDKMYESAEGLARFQAELQNTDFGIELRNKGINTAIRTTVGDLGFDSNNYNRFLVSAANFGWEGDQLKREIYREAFRKNDDGSFANRTAYERVIKSNDFLSVSKIGSDFFSLIPEGTVEKVLIGDMSVDDVQRQQRELAKTRFGHLAELIDQGFTMQDLADPYRRAASQLLEKTVDNIDMSSADFETAYNFTDEKGNKRLMTEGEWQRLLRTDAKYGWQFTNNANEAARGLAQSLAASFGRLV